MTDRLEEYFDRYRYDFTIAKKSQAWFDEQVLLLAKQRISPNKLLVQKKDNLVDSTKPGGLYMFFYDPKHKKTLPYYDKFPLVFPFSYVEGGFIGLNMHYLPYALRVKLMDKLLMFRTNTRMDATTRLKLSWDTLNSVSKFAAAKPCVKMYLYSQIRFSSFLRVSPIDWPTAMMLPVERFEKASKETVWQESFERM